MTSKKVQKRIKFLRENIFYHNKKYFLDHDSEITDYEYDLLLRELKALEGKYPSLKTTDSPTQTVGYIPLSSLRVVKHPYVMTSLENATDIEEVQHFITRREKDLGHSIEGYAVSFKYDGLAVELIYKDGELILGSTRGNGEEGEDITANFEND